MILPMTEDWEVFSLNREFKNIRTMKDIGVLSVEVPLESIQVI